MPKVSVSLPEEIIEFLDNQGKNRSKTIVTILDEYKKAKQKDELEKAYVEYAKFDAGDSVEFEGWEEASLKDIGED